MRVLLLRPSGFYFFTVCKVRNVLSLHTDIAFLNFDIAFVTAVIIILEKCRIKNDKVSSFFVYLHPIFQLKFSIGYGKV